MIITRRAAYDAIVAIAPHMRCGKWTWKIADVREAPGWGWLVTMIPDAPGVPLDQLPLIGNTPYLIRPNGSARSTWPHEFARFYPEFPGATLNYEECGRSIEQLETKYRANLQRAGRREPIPDPGPGPVIRIVPRGAMPRAGLWIVPATAGEIG